MNLNIKEMEKYKGVIIIKGMFGGSKSDGYKAYLVTDDFKNYQLYRKDTLDINDEYFYSFNKKSVEVIGEIQRDKWILVDSVIEIKDEISENENQSFHPIKFAKPEEGFPQLINSEGSILELVESKDPENDLTKERLYLKAFIEPGKSIYAKVNETTLLLFFQGRLSVKELFLLRNDEIYIIEESLNNKKKQTPFYFSENFLQDTINKIQCGNEHYYSLPKDMRIEDPFQEVMKKLELYWSNAHSALNGL
ncbi:hypothetical protein GCM10022388_19650 [Flavobacterium chungnamense]|uniref:Uncharacterized protein n=2 Tax=Flavobacterium chungnamense TaxID=706182 RepID=A0ABP7UUP3_9FLAO